MFVTFELVEEKFCEHISQPVPVSSYSDFNYYCRLWDLDGCLCFVISLRDNKGRCWDVWILKKKDDNHRMKK